MTRLLTVYSFDITLAEFIKLKFHGNIFYILYSTTTVNDHYSKAKDIFSFFSLRIPNARTLKGGMIGMSSHN